MLTWRRTAVAAVAAVGRLVLRMLSRSRRRLHLQLLLRIRCMAAAARPPYPWWRTGAVAAVVAAAVSAAAAGRTAGLWQRRSGRDLGVKYVF